MVQASLPLDVPVGKYELSLGIDTRIPEIGTLHLAIEGRNAEGFYPLGTVEVR